MDIGDGFVIKVVRADFKQNSQISLGKSEGENEAEEEDTDWDDSSRPAPPPGSSSSALSLPQEVRSLPELRGIGSYASAAPSSSSSVAPAAPVSVCVTSGPDRAALYASLPPECEIDAHPVVVILNLFNNSSLSDFVQSFTGGSLEDAVTKFYEDLEADMLVECCGFGRIRFIQVLDLAEEMVLRWGGGVAVTFDVLSQAQECAYTFSKRKVNGRDVVAVVLPPQNGSLVANETEVLSRAGPGTASPGAVVEVPLPPPVSGYTPLDKLPPNVPPPPPPPKVAKPVLSEVLVVTEPTAALQGAVEENGSAPDDLDVDSFLNSLL